MRLRCLSVFFLCLPCGNFVAQDFDIQSQPSWVQAVLQDMGDRSLFGERAGGKWYVLIDEQIDAVSRTHFRHHVIKFENDAGVQEGSEIEITFDPSYEHLVFHQLRIIRGGQYLPRLDRKRIRMLQRERDLERRLFDGRWSAVAVLEDVRAGDIVEYAYSIRGANPVFGGKFAESLTVRWSVGVSRLFYRLLWPMQRPLFVRNHETHLKAKQRDLGQIREYVWESENIQPLVPDPSLPVWYNPYPWIQLSDCKDWKEVTAWALETFALDGPINRDVLEYVDGLRARYATPSAQATAALRFVQDEIRYLGVEVGEYSHKPAHPNNVFSRRFGDCKDKSVLLCAILNALDIEAYPLLVHSEFRHEIHRLQPSPKVFNHVVVQVRLDGKPYWVDATHSYQRGRIESQYFPDYRYGLLVKPGMDELRLIPPRLSGGPTLELEENFAMPHPDSPAVLVVRSLYRSYEADRMRWTLARNPSAQIERNFLNYYAQWYPTVQWIDTLQIVDNPDSNCVQLIERYRIPSMWKADSVNDRVSAFLYAQTIHDVIVQPGSTSR